MLKRVFVSLIGSGRVDGGERTACETETAIIALITMKQTSSEAICMIQNSVVLPVAAVALL